MSKFERFHFERHDMEAGDQNMAAPSIRLEFFRHDERATKPGESDDNSRLTADGRRNATAVGKTKFPQPEVAIAYGSPRERSIETALRQMLANREEINGNTDLEGIRELVSERLPVGRKDLVDERLNFHWEGEYKKTATEYYRDKKDYLVFAVEESDDVVRKYKDMNSTSYTRQAAGIAELVKKYVEISPRWERLVQDNPDKFKDFNNELQRFFGSHGTVTECFLLKVIEKKEGIDVVREFLAELPDKNGLGYSEGFTVNIKKDKEMGEAEVIIDYKDRSWTMNLEEIEQIIEDKKLLDKSIADAEQ